MSSFRIRNYQIQYRRHNSILHIFHGYQYDRHCHRRWRENTYSISNHYKIIENTKIEEGTLLKSTDDSLHPFDYHLGNYSEGAFKTTECNQIHSFHVNEETEKDDQDEVILGARKEKDDWVVE